MIIRRSLSFIKTSIFFWKIKSSRHLGKKDYLFFLLIHFSFSKQKNADLLICFCFTATLLHAMRSEVVSQGTAFNYISSLYQLVCCTMAGWENSCPKTLSWNSAQARKNFLSFYPHYDGHTFQIWVSFFKHWKKIYSSKNLGRKIFLKQKEKPALILGQKFSKLVIVLQLSLMLLNGCVSVNFVLVSGRHSQWQQLLKKICPCLQNSKARKQKKTKMWAYWPILSPQKDHSELRTVKLVQVSSERYLKTVFKQQNL